MKPKTTLVPGGYPAGAGRPGRVEMVVHQISEIVPVKGVTLVGPLPREIQKVTVYSAGIATKSTSPDAARAFVAFLTSPTLKPRLAAAGSTTRSDRSLRVVEDGPETCSVLAHPVAELGAIPAAGPPSCSSGGPASSRGTVDPEG
jgi:hypothetical protein